MPPSKKPKKDVAFVREMRAEMPWWFNMEKFLERLGLNESDIEVVYEFIEIGEKRALREQLQSLLEELAPDKFYEDNFGEDYVAGIRTVKYLLTTRLEKLQ